MSLTQGGERRGRAQAHNLGVAGATPAPAPSRNGSRHSAKAGSPLVPARQPRTLTVKLPRPHPAQAELLPQLRRFNALNMGRRFGKTTLGIQRLTPALHGYPVAWYSPTYKMLEEVWRETKHAYRQVIARPVEAQKRLELVTGGVIEFWSLDSADSSRGRKYKRVIVDEAAMISNLEEAWQAVIRPTLTDLKGEADFYSTPKGRNFFYDLHARGCSDSYPDWFSATAPTTANPYIDPAEVEAARLELPELVFRQEYLAEFVDAAGARISRAWLKHAPSPPVELLTITMGVDLAISTKTDADYTAAVILGRAQDGTLYVLDVQRIRAPFHQVLRFIESLAGKWRPSSIAIEQVQYQAAVIQELLRTTRLPVVGVKPDRDKVTRFQPLEARYQQGLIVHATGLSSDFEDELLTFPIGTHDDMVDALAYAYTAPIGSAFSVKGATA